MNTTQTTKAFKLLGINDDECTCTLCGRQELKAVMWLENTETGDIFFVGRNCGAKLLKVGIKEFRAFEKSEVSRQTSEARAAFDAAPEVVACKFKNTEVLSVQMSFQSRTEIMTPHWQAVTVIRKELEKKFPLARMFWF